jgi:K+-transporting ATPase ATPase A chain
MSYLTEMAGRRHNFYSAAVGIVVTVAIIRGIKRTSSSTIGNFWVDTTRTLLYILMPACVIYALLLVARAFPKTCVHGSPRSRSDTDIGRGLPRRKPSDAGH